MPFVFVLPSTFTTRVSSLTNEYFISKVDVPSLPVVESPSPTSSAGLCILCTAIFSANIGALNSLIMSQIPTNSRLPLAVISPEICANGGIKFFKNFELTYSVSSLFLILDHKSIP